MRFEIRKFVNNDRLIRNYVYLSTKIKSPMGRNLIKNCSSNFRN